MMENTGDCSCNEIIDSKCGGFSIELSNDLLKWNCTICKQYQKESSTSGGSQLSENNNVLSDLKSSLLFKMDNMEEKVNEANMRLNNIYRTIDKFSNITENFFNNVEKFKKDNNDLILSNEELKIKVMDLEKGLKYTNEEQDNLMNQMSDMNAKLAEITKSVEELKQKQDSQDVETSPQQIITKTKAISKPKKKDIKSKEDQPAEDIKEEQQVEELIKSTTEDLEQEKPIEKETETSTRTSMVLDDANRLTDETTSKTKQKPQTTKKEQDATLKQISQQEQEKRRDVNLSSTESTSAAADSQQDQPMTKKKQTKLKQEPIQADDKTILSSTEPISTAEDSQQVQPSPEEKRTSLKRTSIQPDDKTNLSKAKPTSTAGDSQQEQPVSKEKRTSLKRTSIQPDDKTNTCCVISSSKAEDVTQEQPVAKEDGITSKQISIQADDDANISTTETELKKNITKTPTSETEDSGQEQKVEKRASLKKTSNSVEDNGSRIIIETTSNAEGSEQVQPIEEGTGTTSKRASIQADKNANQSTVKTISKTEESEDQPVPKEKRVLKRTSIEIDENSNRINIESASITDDSQEEQPSPKEKRTSLKPKSIQEDDKSSLSTTEAASKTGDSQQKQLITKEKRTSLKRTSIPNEKDKKQLFEQKKTERVTNGNKPAKKISKVQTPDAKKKSLSNNTGNAPLKKSSIPRRLSSTQADKKAQSSSIKTTSKTEDAEQEQQIPKEMETITRRTSITVDDKNKKKSFEEKKIEPTIIGNKVVKRTPVAKKKFSGTLSSTKSGSNRQPLPSDGTKLDNKNIKEETQVKKKSRVSIPEKGLRKSTDGEKSPISKGRKATDGAKSPISKERKSRDSQENVEIEKEQKAPTAVGEVSKTSAIQSPKQLRTSKKKSDSKIEIKVLDSKTKIGKRISESEGEANGHKQTPEPDVQKETNVSSKEISGSLQTDQSSNDENIKKRVSFSSGSPAVQEIGPPSKKKYKLSFLKEEMWKLIMAAIIPRIIEFCVQKEAAIDSNNNTFELECTCEEDKSEQSVKSDGFNWKERRSCEILVDCTISSKNGMKNSCDHKSDKHSTNNTNNVASGTKENLTEKSNNNEKENGSEKSKKERKGK